jgi:hypothetical protein
MVEGVIEVKKTFQAARKVQKLPKNSRFSALTDLKNDENTVYT